MFYRKKSFPKRAGGAREFVDIEAYIKEGVEELFEQKMEELKLAGFSAIAVPEPTVALEGEEAGYSWQADVSDISLEGVSSSEDLRQLRLKVSWTEKEKTRSQNFVTYISR